MTWRPAPRAVAPLRHRGFRLLVAGQVTSSAGDACYAVALPWFVLAGHGGTVLLGSVLAAYGIPRTALIMAGGWASDRWRPQTVGVIGLVIAAQAVFGLCNGFGNTYTVTAFQRWAPAGSLGRLNGLLLLTSFGMAPVSVLLAAWFGHALGPAAFFLFAAVTIAVAVLGGLTQRTWRDFGTVPRVRPAPELQAVSPRRAGPAARNAGGKIAAT